MRRENYEESSRATRNPDVVRAMLDDYAPDSPSTATTRKPTAGVSLKRCNWPGTARLWSWAGRVDMTETLVAVEPSEKDPATGRDERPPAAAELDAARELVRLARDRGVALTGPGGLLKALTKTVLETALDEEMSEHLGYDKHDPVGPQSAATPATAAGPRRC